MSGSEKSPMAVKFGISEPPEFTDADAETINSGPAIYANKIFATVSPLGMRVTFAEVNSASPKAAFRSAVFISLPDAAALMELLERQLGLVEPIVIPTEKP